MVRWDEEEKRVLKEVWGNPKISSKDLPQVFKGRTLDSIRKKAEALSLGAKAVERPQIDYEFLKSLVDVKDI